jgi:hypothetical protein
VIEVNGDCVLLDAGCLQNLSPGEYNVFEPTVTEAGVSLGKESSDWLCSIDVNEGLIGPLTSNGSILERKPEKNEKIRVSKEIIS